MTDACFMPSELSPLEEKVFKTLREHHCNRDHGYRECAGRIVIDRNGMTLACPKCGDCRQRFTGQVAEIPTPTPTLE